MKRKLILIAALVMLAAVILAAPCYADTVGWAVVTGSNVRLRTGPDSSGTGNIVTEMPQGTFLLVEEKLDGWYKVAYHGVTGYVSASYARFAETVDGTYKFEASTKGTDVNLRAAAGTASGVVKTLKTIGTKLTVLGVSGNWVKVSDASGAVGFIRSDLLVYAGGAGTASEQYAAAFGTKGQQIAQLAQQYKGYAYTWGGMSPATGFDCSGFANYICKQNGISLHRVAQDIYSNDGTWVSKDALQPGDLLFFGYGPYCVTHMGIYVGGGQMIHASTSTTGVIYSVINSNYYTRMYVGAKRVA